MAKGTRTRIVAAPPARASGFRAIPVALDHERTIRYNSTQAQWLEKNLKVNCLDGSLWENMNIGKLTTILWRGLLHEDAGLTLEVVGDIFPMDRLEEITDACMAAWGIDVEANRRIVEEVQAEARKKAIGKAVKGKGTVPEDAPGEAVQPDPPQ